MPRYLASLSLLLAGLVPFGAGALGLGEIDLKSSLNQPFSAEIEVSSESSNDLQGLEVGLASAETFAQFGVDRAPFLTDFDFVVVTENGGTRIDITSVQPVVEPFVTLLLEIRWQQGRLLREFTVLLDPPTFAAAEVEPAIQESAVAPAPVPAETQIIRAVPEQPAQAAPVAVEPESEPISVTPVIAAPAPAVESEPVPTEPVRAAAETPAQPARVEPQASVSPTAAGAADGTYGPVARNDTLWAIAGRVAPDDSVDRNQMMLAIFRANPEAFAGNINRLKAGVILRVPEADELNRLGRIEARNEVQRQEDTWSQSSASTAKLRLVPPPEEGAVDSAGAETGSDVSSSGVATTEQQALQQRIQELESELGDNERLLQLRDQEMQALQDQLAALQQGEATAAEIEEPGVAEEPVDEIVEDITDPFASDEIDAGDAEEGLDGEEILIADDAVSGVDETDEAGPDVDTVQSDVVTTAGADGEPSLIGALLTNIWFYVSLFGVLIIALFVVRRRSSEPEPPIGEWDELRAEEPGLGEAEALPADAGYASATPEEATFIVEEAPSEPTMQEGTVGDLAGDFPGESQDELSPAVEDGPEVGADGADQDLLGDDLRVDSADEDLFAEAPEEDAALEPEVSGEVPHETALERTISIASGANLDQVDPLAEADFHMAYGLYDQAADLLTEELRTAPERKDLRLKLLEVYFIWENAAGFLREAEDIKAMLAGDSDPDWNKVLIMGKQICPDEALFSGTAESSGDAGDMDLMLADDDAGDDSYDVDFPMADVSFDGITDMPDLDLTDMGGADAGGLNFELGSDDLDADELNASTMETPTIESPLVVEDEAAGDASASTMETPTVDIAALEPTIESKFDGELEDQPAGESTMETPTVDIAALEPTMEMSPDDLSGGESTMETPTVDMPAIESSLEATFDDQEVTGKDFSVDDGVESDTPSGEEEPLEMSSLDLAAETLQIELDEDTNIRNASQGLGAADNSPAGEDSITDDYDDIFMDLDPTEVLQKGARDDLLDETVEQSGSDDTAEQPQAGSHADTFSTLQIAEGSGQETGMEASTMTEVGTKLDLARAYIDMGDPDGARSILNEVLEEAGDSQRQEAQQLLAGLG